MPHGHMTHTKHQPQIWVRMKGACHAERSFITHTKAIHNTVYRRSFSITNEHLLPPLKAGESVLDAAVITKANAIRNTTAALYFLPILNPRKVAGGKTSPILVVSGRRVSTFEPPRPPLLKDVAIANKSTIEGNRTPAAAVLTLPFDCLLAAPLSFACLAPLSPVHSKPPRIDEEINLGKNFSFISVM